LTDDFWPVQVPQLKYQGKWYVLPENISSIALRFRPEFFEEAGIAYPEKPWTYQDLHDVAAKLTKQENGKTVRWGFDPGWMLTGTSFAYLWLPAGIVDAEQNKAIIDHPENVRALNMLQDMKFKEHIIPRTEDLPEGVDLFANDQIAMNAAGVWDITSTRDAMQEKHWDVVWLPSNPLKPEENLSINYGAGYAMGRDTKAPEASWRLIRYLSEPERQQVLIVNDTWALPGRKSVTEAWRQSVLTSGSKEPQHVKVWVDALETGRSVPVTPAAQELEEQYPNLIGPVLTTGDARAEDLLPQIQADLQKILDKYA
ncbi:MAG TPA: extracellular solute-binding protein, partial [Herpetosiphonaceae bacterium]|nr:extracellular solute-binding protein [Herpetosiphonaceae bacterium]